jgi:hypothetical protein
MIGAGPVIIVIIVLIVMAIIIYNSQKELSELKKEDTFLVKAVKKITKSSTQFVSDKLELDASSNINNHTDINSHANTKKDTGIKEGTKEETKNEETKNEGTKKDIKTNP